jgi:drug/metabolite transporter (DMT)-like permease
VEIVIFLISSLLPVVYVFLGFLCDIKRRDSWALGFASFFYILTVLNRIFGSDSGDFSEIINGNSLMHLGIIIFVYSVYQKIKKIA